MNRVTYLVGPLLLIITTVVLMGCAAKRPRAAAHTDEYDRQFLVHTLDHLDGDLRIARTCKGKRIHLELATFCAELYNDQAREYARMAGWLIDWYGENPAVESFPLWIESQDGESFEHYFLKGVLEEHREIAKRAADCTRSAKHAELAAFCQEVTQHRTQEAARMEKWNCEWFKKCD